MSDLTTPPTTSDDAPPHRYTAELARDIELGWQDWWIENGTFETPNTAGPLADPEAVAERGERLFVLDMFPYPSGTGLHVGHPLGFIGTDVFARFKRMTGHNVLHAMGFDAFGLPAENAAIQRGVAPRAWTEQNIAHMRTQMRSMGAMFDWSAEVVTCEPAYYRWNQWLFLKMLERGLAYRRRAPVDFCPQCNTTLAREQVVGEDRVCERCSTAVVKRELDQWFLRTTVYADELLDGLDGIDWPERV